MTRVQVSVIIPSFNTRDVLLRALASFHAAKAGVTTETIIVDNGSTDGSADAVARERPDVRLIRNRENRGFARAVNQGMRVAQGAAYLLLNSDTEMPAPFLRALLDYLDAHPDVAVVAPKVLNRDGSDQGTARSFPTAWAFIFGRRSPLTRLWPGNPWSRRYLTGRAHGGTDPFEVDFVSGACMLVRGSAAHQVGLLDEGFFMYWEDADWCRRFRNAGWKTCCLPGVAVVHHQGLSSLRSLRLIIEFHRSVYHYFCKHHARGRRWLRVLAATALSGRAGVLLLVAASRRAIR